MFRLHVVSVFILLGGAIWPMQSATGQTPPGFHRAVRELTKAVSELAEELPEAEELGLGVQPEVVSGGIVACFSVGLTALVFALRDRRERRRKREGVLKLLTSEMVNNHFRLELYRKDPQDILRLGAEHIVLLGVARTHIPDIAELCPELSGGIYGAYEACEMFLTACLKIVRAREKAAMRTEETDRKMGKLVHRMICELLALMRKAIVALPEGQEQLDMRMEELDEAGETTTYTGCSREPGP